MSTRISRRIILVALPLAACGEQRAAETSGPEDPRVMIACAQGQSALRRTCTVQREQARNGLVLTVRHANGAFRRLLVTRDGRGVTAADGAEPATVRVLGSDEIEVSLGADRYRLPATIKDAKPAA